LVDATGSLEGGDEAVLASPPVSDIIEGPLARLSSTSYWSRWTTRRKYVFDRMACFGIIPIPWQCI
jgi:hypothetical protein